MALSMIRREASSRRSFCVRRRVGAWTGSDRTSVGISVLHGFGVDLPIVTQ
jgi:hypothetical protein